MYMNKKIKKFLIFCSLNVLFFFNVQGAEKLYFIKGCNSCHGDDAQGNIVTKAPALAGQSDWYIIEQLQKFKKKYRGYHPEDVQGKIMIAIAETLSTEEIEQLASYISEQPKVTNEQVISGEPEKGKPFYATCMACHGADGKGNELFKAPSLIVLSDWYVYDQINKFKKGHRGGDFTKEPQAAAMRAIVSTLPNDRAVKDVVTYIGSLSK